MNWLLYRSTLSHSENPFQVNCFNSVITFACFGGMLFLLRGAVRDYSAFCFNYFIYLYYFCQVFTPGHLFFGLYVRSFVSKIRQKLLDEFP